MDGLTKKITQNNRAALNLVKSLLNTPTLINADPTQGWPYALQLECETYQESASATVSESLVICADSKKNIADNVAPGAWTWNLGGYIPGNKTMEPTNYYTPFVKLNSDILRQWFKKGAVLVFKDQDARIHQQVVIQSLNLTSQKDARNVQPFSMTLKEINTMYSGILEMNEVEKAADITEGSILGTAAACGTMIATVTDTVVTDVKNSKN